MGERTLCEACFAVVNSCCASEFADFETLDPDHKDNTKGIEPEA